jgi:hypothetical protein
VRALTAPVLTTAAFSGGGAGPASLYLQTVQDVTRQIAATNAGGPAASWSWDFGPTATPSTSAAAKPGVAFSTPGAYDCSVVATNAKGSSELDFRVIVAAAEAPYIYLNRPTTMTDSDQAGYAATFTTDFNGNITLITEALIVGLNVTTLYSYFDLDDLNRVTANRVKWYDGSNWQWIKRSHTYSATGATLQSNYKTWQDGSTEPAGNDLLHSWDQGGKHVQNTDTGGTTFGAVWHWAGSTAGPLKSPNADTAGNTAYNTTASGGAGTPQRRKLGQRDDARRPAQPVGPGDLLPENSTSSTIEIPRE